MARRLWDVWMEGYVATGESALATYYGKYQGRTFAEACEKWAEETGHDDRLFDRDKLSYWGCRLFDNEADARRIFG